MMTKKEEKIILLWLNFNEDLNSICCTHNNIIKCLIAEMSCVYYYFTCVCILHKKNETEKKTRECKQSLLNITSELWRPITTIQDTSSHLFLWLRLLYECLCTSIIASDQLYMNL